MLLRVTDLPAEGIHIAERLDPANFKELAALRESQACEFKGPLAVNLWITPAAGLFYLKGSLKGAVRMTCNRCLAIIERPLESAFRLTLARSLPGGEKEGGPENRQLKAEDMGIVLFYGDEIDLRDMLQEQAIMAIPMQVLCREDCRGLCAGCGADLNTEVCRCSGDEIDPRLAALKKLKL